jgi:hypothetical protein
VKRTTDRHRTQTELILKPYEFCRETVRPEAHSLSAAQLARGAPISRSRSSAKAERSLPLFYSSTAIGTWFAPFGDVVLGSDRGHKPITVVRKKWQILSENR